MQPSRFHPRLTRTTLSAFVVVVVVYVGQVMAGEYRPTSDDGPHKVTTLEDTWADAKRGGREVPVKVYLPDGDGKEPMPVIVFSHGLGGSRDGYEYLGRFWASHGYISVHPQHAGSDDGVWRNKTSGERAKAMFTAARSATVALNRAGDLPFVLDTLEKLNKDEDSPFFGKLNMQSVGMAGHSYGAWSTLVAGGQALVSPSGRALDYSDDRIKAIIPMSAPVPRSKTQRGRAYRGIAVPALHMTGTLDESRINPTTAEDRRIPFDQIPGPTGGGAESWLIILKDGDHMVFSGSKRLRREKTALDKTHHRLIRQASLAFWDAHLRGSKEAHRWLAQDGLEEAVGDEGTVEKKTRAAAAEPAAVDTGR